MGAHAFGGAMLWRSSISVTLLESAVARNVAANPLECALTKLLDLKPFRICSYKKCGWGAPKMRLPSCLKAGDMVELGNRQPGVRRGRNCSPIERQKRYMLTADLNASRGITVLGRSGAAAHLSG